MKILLVEDDHLQEEAILASIRKEFPGVAIETICTELEFRQRLDALVASPPDLVILDVMIRWTDPGPDLALNPPPWDVEGRYYQAGLRCEQLLRASAPGVPVVLYTILDKKDLERAVPSPPGRVCYLAKGADPKPLLEKIHRLMGS
jgi:DNA-binding NarL/FixJ family response regulator